jgi:hypothetical protein
MEKKLNEIEVHLAEIKKDLKYHIKRTDELERMVTPTYKLYIFGSYFLKGIAPLAAVAAIIAVFN